MRNNRFSATTVALFAALFALAGAFAGTAEAATSGSWSEPGNRNTALVTSNASISINTAADLAQLAYLSNYSPYLDFEDKTIVLAGGLDLSAHYWEPIAVSISYGRVFKGTFNGSNQTISGLVIQSTTPAFGMSSIGLFGQVGAGGTVKNVKIVGCDISVVDSYSCGAVVGRLTAGGKVENCSSDGTVRGHANVGGVVGYVPFWGLGNGEVTDCESACAVEGDNQSIGGVVGYLGGSDTIGTSFLRNSHSTGTVTGLSQVGGVVGYAGYYFKVENCYHTTGAVTGSDREIGGVAGTVGYGTVDNCYNTANVTGGSGPDIGGVVGRMNGNGPGGVKNSYNTGNVSGTGATGGVVGSTSYSSVTNNYNTGDVSGHLGGTVGYSYVGGVVGFASSVGYLAEGSVSNNYNAGAVSGAGSYIGGVIGSVSSSVVTNNYSVGTVSGTGASSRVSGVAGYAASSSLTRNVALNQSVSGALSSNVRRVISFKSGGSSTGNRAFAGMTVTPTPGTANADLDGEDMTKANIATASYWVSQLAWPAPWSLLDGRLPILSGVGGTQLGTIPLYLVEQPKSITQFTINTVNGTINESAGTITVGLPNGTNVTNLSPTITHTGASVSPASGAPGDFSSPVTYTVTATDTSTKLYVVTVQVAPASGTQPAITTASPLLEGTVYSPYSAALAATGTTPITWSISLGALPDGLGIEGTTGVISGTPTESGTFTFTVKADNGLGTADTKVFALTVITVPGAPTIGTATAVPSAGSATVTFTAPAGNGGSPITSYTVTSSPGNKTATGTASPITVTGLSGWSCTFTVTATNAAGTGPASASSNSITPTGSTPPSGDGGGSGGTTIDPFSGAITEPTASGGIDNGDDDDDDNGVGASGGIGGCDTGAGILAAFALIHLASTRIRRR